jgi:hypothetical protein
VVVCRDADGNSREREMDGKTIIICADARKRNQCTVPDRERTPPMQESLQRFESARYVTLLEFSSAYLETGLRGRQDRRDPSR